MQRLLIIIVVLMVTCPAVCDETTNDNTDERANEFFQRGRVLFEAQEYGAAAEAFGLAYETATYGTAKASYGERLTSAN